MTLADTRERQRRAVLARLTELQRQLYQAPTEAQRRAAAEALGRADLLPEPQGELPLARRLGSR